MTEAITNLYQRIMGPIFDTELRRSSRKKRYYWLRSSYLIILTLFLVFVWLQVSLFRSFSGGAFSVSRMAQMGLQASTIVIWFQFIVSQILVVIMMSTAICGEITRRTFGVLLTTPLSSLQIVLGKYLSRLLPVVLVIAMSLPLLAVIRVFGGVVWEYLISGFCITVTAILFNGALCLFLSVSSRSTHLVLLKSLVVLGVFYILPPLVLSLASFWAPGGVDAAQSIVSLFNPFMALGYISTAVYSAAPSFGTVFTWPLHCLIMFGGALVFLALTSWRIRHQARNLIFGETGHSGFRSLFKKQGRKGMKSNRVTARSIRPVEGKPIIWKELQKSYLSRMTTRVWPILIIEIAFLVVACILYFVACVLYLTFENEIAIAVGQGVSSIFYGLAFIITGAMAACSVVSEKEAQTLPTLLTTPLTNQQVVYGKGLAVLRRSLPLWIVPLVLNLVFLLSSTQIRHFAISTMIGIPTSILFLIGAGLYFSVRLKTTLTAIIATFVACFVESYVLGMLLMIVMMILTFSSSGGMDPEWMFVYQIVGSVVSGVIRIVLGVWFLTRAKANLRRYALTT
jgi:ABC-type transport system involved in multi-copper enzyme maturation permease subunit